MEDFEGTVTTGSASLGWFSPVVLRDVTLLDAEGRPLLAVADLASDKTLLSLLKDRPSVGLFRVNQPHLQLVLRVDGSNIEDALAPLLTPKEESSPIGFSVEIVEGRIDVTETATGRQWTVANVNLSLDKPLDASAATTIKIAAATTGDANAGDGQQPATVDAAVMFRLPDGASPESLGEGELTIKSQGLPLSVARAALRRFAPGVELSGRLTAEVQCQWQGDRSAPTVTAAGRVDTAALSLTAPQWLQNDRLQAERFNAHGKVAYRGGRIELTPLTIDSDLANVEVTGAADVARLSEEPPLPWLMDVLQREDLQIEGRADLAKTTRTLPQTLRIREGTRITSGNVQLTLTSRAEQASRRWDARVATADLQAVADGKPVVWDQPIEITLAAHQTDAGPVVDRLTCSASFLQLSAAGTLQQGNLSARGDLDRLAAELGRFVDLGSLTLAGRLEAKLACRRTKEDQFFAEGDLAIEQFRFSMPGKRPLNERRLEIRLSADGLADENGIRRIDRATAIVVSDRDRLEARLAGPVEQPSLNTAWPLVVQLNGELATWMPRLQPWLPMTGWDIRGTIESSAAASVSKNSLRVGSLKADVVQLRAFGPGVYISEPIANLQAVGTWDGAKRQFKSQDITLAGTSLAIRGRDVAVQLTEEGLPHLAGDVAFRVDLAGVDRWMQDPGKPPGRKIAGQLAGIGRLSYADGVTSGEATADVTNLSLAYPQQPTADKRPAAVAGPPVRTPSWKTVFSEPKLALAGNGSYNHGQDRLQLASLELADDAVRFSATGKIERLTGSRSADLTGRIDYDLEKVAVRLKPYFGENLKVAGRQSRQFALSGPLVFIGDAPKKPASGVATAQPVAVSAAGQKAFVWPPDLSARAGLGWDSAAAYGLLIGPGQIDAQLEKGTVRFAPLDLAVSKGRVKLSPWIVLGKSPPMLYAEKGRAIDDVQLSEQICASWMKYVAPLLADATRTDGRFSMDLSHVSVPLMAPSTGDVAGVLRIRSAQVRPGPVAQQFLWIGQQVQAMLERRALPGSYVAARDPLLSIVDQNVEFRMVDGRVYHRGLTIDARGVIIRTSGSVGLDQSLDLVAEVPILDAWVDRDRLLHSLRGQTVQIPIGGTLKKPAVDRRGLQQLAEKIVAGAAGRLIEDEIQKQLEGLFKRKQ